jgi:hypothetical protein
MGDIEWALHRRETFNVSNGEAEANVTLIIGLPVLHEIADVLDINTRARNLPQTSMSWLAACTRFTLVAGLLEELAAQAGPKFPDLMGLLSLIRPERSSPPTNTLLGDMVFLSGVGRGLLDNSLRDLAADRALLPATWRRVYG